MTKILLTPGEWEGGQFSCRAIKSKVTGQYVLEDDNPELVRRVYNALDNCESSQDNYIGLRDSDTGKINAIKFEWDGAVLEREDIPNLFDRIVDVLELNPDQAEILIKKDFM